MYTKIKIINTDLEHILNILNKEIFTGVFNIITLNDKCGVHVKYHQLKYLVPDMITCLAYY